MGFFSRESWETRKAKKLQSLREKRIKEENRAKLRKYEVTERKRIEKAKATRGPSFFQKATEEVQKFSNAPTTKRRIKKKRSRRKTNTQYVIGGKAYVKGSSSTRKKRKSKKKTKRVVTNIFGGTYM